MNRQQINDLRHDLVLVFDFRSDDGCELITEVYQTILDYHQIESNGRCEDEDEMELVDKLVEFMNAMRPPDIERFTQFLNDYVFSLYPNFITEKEYIQRHEEF